jgi:hypothetical protein
VVWIKPSRGLHVLDEDPVLALWIDEADKCAPRSWPWGGVDKPEAVTRSLGQRRRDVIHTQREVMQPLAPNGDEAAQIRLCSKRLEQLDICRTRAEERDANVRKAFIALYVEAEAGLEMNAGGVY